ncbi:ALKBH8 family protein [Megaselia abdita]
MMRVLRKGGRCLIYVWARDQKKDLKKSSYLRQNKAVNKNKKSELEQREETALSQEIPNVDISLPIHTNRTEFQQQDVYVPWKLKGTQQEQVFLRYYHVFEESELEKLCKEIKGVEVEKSYYDQGNHCVILKKSLI